MQDRGPGVISNVLVGSKGWSYGYTSADYGDFEIGY
jgi:hypothetical protein